VADQLQDVWELHRADVGDIVRTQSDRLLNKPGDTSMCKADVRTMRMLVKALAKYTDQVFEAAINSGWLGAGAGITADDSYWTKPSQWALDFSRWQERLRAYEDAIGSAEIETGMQSCLSIFDAVTQPLLLGWYLPGTPGIINPDRQTIPDIATPFMLGNQVFEYKDARLDRMKKLVDDVIAEAKKLIKKAVDAGTSTLPLIIGGLAIGAGALLALRALPYNRRR